jgi:hypothetical protein
MEEEGSTEQGGVGEPHNEPGPTCPKLHLRRIRAGNRCVKRRRSGQIGRSQHVDEANHGEHARQKERDKQRRKDKGGLLGNVGDTLSGR